MRKNAVSLTGGAKPALLARRMERRHEFASMRANIHNHFSLARWRTPIKIDLRASCTARLPSHRQRRSEPSSLGWRHDSEQSRSLDQ